MRAPSPTRVSSNCARAASTLLPDRGVVVGAPGGGRLLDPQEGRTSREIADRQLASQVARIDQRLAGGDELAHRSLTQLDLDLALVQAAQGDRGFAAAAAEDCIQTLPDRRFEKAQLFGQPDDEVEIAMIDALQGHGDLQALDLDDRLSETGHALHRSPPAPPAPSFSPRRWPESSSARSSSASSSCSRRKAPSATGLREGTLSGLP
jgi:hypothetical protein